MRTIAMINQKGGVGKTTSAANLASGLAARGYNVAAIDLDPQSHLTMHFGVEPGAPELGVYEVLTAGTAISAASICVEPQLWLVPSSIDLVGAEVELVSMIGREQLLADRLAEEKLPYDYVLIDCPPSLGLLTLNALAAADEVIIPLQPHFLALQGLGKLLETVSLVRRRINPRLRVGGVLMCLYESSTRLAGEVQQDVEDFFAGPHDPDAAWAQARLFRTRIRRNIKLAECPSFGKTIYSYDPTCHGAADYNALVDEFLEIHGQETSAEAATPTPTDAPSPEPSQRDSAAAAESTQPEAGPHENAPAELRAPEAAMPAESIDPPPDSAPEPAIEQAPATRAEREPETITASEPAAEPEPREQNDHRPPGTPESPPT